MGRQVPPAAPDALRRCVGDVERFLAEAWTRRPHLHERDGDDDLSDLLSLDDVDRLLATASLRTPAFRLVRDGRALPASTYTRAGTIGGRGLADLIDVGRVHAHVAEGATVVLQGLHRYWEPVARFCREIELYLTQPVQANAYVTPPVAEGLAVHHDTHDVLALQTHGSKRWVVHEPVVEQPLTSHRWSGAEHEAGPPVVDVTLRAGDCLYVPRGTPHAAATVDGSSVHLAIGIRSTTWHDVVADVLAETADDLRFREALPAGYAKDPDAFGLEVAAKLKELATWLEEVDGRRVAARTARRFWTGRPPVLSGQLRQLLALDTVDDDTVVRRRDAIAARLEPTPEGRVELLLGDRVVDLPAAAGPALRRLLEVEELRVGDLDDLLDAPGRLVLVRRLVREGLLVADLGR